MKKILVTGGAGYIGSHTILTLIKSGYEVISIDDFSNSTDENFSGIYTLTGKNVENYCVDLKNANAVKEVFENHKDIDTVIHFAASKYVGESCLKPIMYYRNNLLGLINILDSMKENNIANLVFSSSCTVYGSPEQLPVDEDTPIKPAESPYGRSKQMCEDIICDTVKYTPGLNAIILRYFNPAGLHESGLIRETTTKPQETLMPIVSEVLRGIRKELVVFGTDYDTRDGTAIRDYIHVVDLAAAHVAAIPYFKEIKDKRIDVFNLGLGKGVSVQEIVNAVSEVSGRQLNYSLGARRTGDIPATYADNGKARKLLNWSAKYTIKDVIESIL